MPNSNTFQSSDKSFTKGFLNRLVSATSFGLIPLFSIPVLSAGMSLPSMLVYRFGLGCIGILLVLLYKRIPLSITLKEGAEIALLALCYDVEALLMILGYNYMPSGIATTLVFSYPIWTEILMLCFFHERFSRSTILSLFLAFMGVALLSGFSGGAVRPLGVVIELAAGLSYSFYMVLLPQMRVSRMDALKLTFWVFLFGVIIFFIFTTLFFGGVQPYKDGAMFLRLLMLGLVCTALSNVTLIPAIRQIGATLTAILGAFEPLTAMIIGIVVFGDYITLHATVGFILVLVSVTVVVMSKMNLKGHKLNNHS